MDHFLGLLGLLVVIGAILLLLWPALWAAQRVGLLPKRAAGEDEERHSGDWGG